MAFEPIFQSYTSTDSPLLLPYKFANGAIIVVFAFLVPLLTMEINYFRLGLFRIWFLMEKQLRRGEGRTEEEGKMDNVLMDTAAEKDDTTSMQNDEEEKKLQELSQTESNKNHGDNNPSSSNSHMQQLLHEAQDDYDDLSSLGEEAISSILLDSNILTTHPLCDTSLVSSLPIEISSISHHNNRDALLYSYSIIRKSSLWTILFWISLYLLTAVGIIVNTTGLEEKVVAIIGGASKFMASLLLFIVSAKIPQWLGVYHQGSIVLVKHSSYYSQHLSNRILLSDDPTNISKLKKYVRRGVGFHFAKFYIVLMPFYCGSSVASVLLSMFLGAVVGFLLMWAVFMVHKKYIHRRNIVAFSTIFILIAISSLTFVRGIAWIQVVWHQDIFEDGDALLAISFFSWLSLLVLVHALFLWHTFKVEKKTRLEKAQEAQSEHGGIDDSNRSSSRGGMRRVPSFAASLPRQPSRSSHLFDPRTHFKDGKCKFSDLSEFGNVDDDSASILTMEQQVQQQQKDAVGHVTIEMVTNGFVDQNDLDPCIKNDASNATAFQQERHENTTPPMKQPRHRRPAWCNEFICFSSEYKASSPIWKMIVWTKIIVISMANLLFLYFVIVCIGATAQAKKTMAKLPYVHGAIYDHMNEGEVCAFDNRGADSNITTFSDANAAHDEGFLILHCGACGACSSLENLKLEWTTRNTISELANDCAKRGLFGGDDAITECLMHPSIGWGASCAQCWMEDIVCTKEHCAFIFLQSQMINNVMNFDVGPDDVTSATCEEANCEAGNPGTFVDCSGATRRRMNITSSIARPGEQQCSIVDVKDWEDLFFGSGKVE